MENVEKKPLEGMRVLVTRARHQAEELAAKIEEWGGKAFAFPVLDIRFPTRPEALEALDGVLRNLEKFDWVVFTSANGVEFFIRRVLETNTDPRFLDRIRIAAVGPKTAEALTNRGLKVETLPVQYNGEALLQELSVRMKRGQRILLPRSHIAQKYIPAALREMGMDVTEVDVYETGLCRDYGPQILELLNQKAVDAITFTSPSSFSFLVEILKELGVERPVELLNGFQSVAIGPKTAEALRKAGMDNFREAVHATVQGILETLVLCEREKS